MPVRKGRLKPEDEDRIKFNYEYLKDEVDAKDIVNTLFSKNVFTADDKEEIINLPSRGKRTEKMLDTLLHSGPGEAYEVFMNALKEDYHHVFEKIEATPVERKESVNNEAWYAGLPDTLKKRKLTDSDASRLSSIDGINWTQFFMRLDAKVSYSEEKYQGDPCNSVAAALIKWRHRKVGEANIGNFMNLIFELDKERGNSIDWEKLREVMDRIAKEQ